MISISRGIEPYLQYPCLMESDHYVVLFSSPKCGIIVHKLGDEGFHELGYYTEHWDMNVFYPCRKEIILKP